MRLEFFGNDGENVTVEVRILPKRIEISRIYGDEFYNKTIALSSITRVEFGDNFRVHVFADGMYITLGTFDRARKLHDEIAERMG